MIPITTINAGNVAQFVQLAADHLTLPEGRQRNLATQVLRGIICSRHYADHVICYPGWDVGRVAQVKTALTNIGEPFDFWIVPTPNHLYEEHLEALNQNRLFYWRAPALKHCKHRYLNFLKWLYEQDLEDVTEIRYGLYQARYGAAMLNDVHPSFYQENKENDQDHEWESQE